jgi:hypothetical protein
VDGWEWRTDANGWEWCDATPDQQEEEVRCQMSNTTISGMTDQERAALRRMEERLERLETENATLKQQREAETLRAQIEREYQEAAAAKEAEAAAGKAEPVPAAPEPEKKPQQRRWF